MHQYLKLALKQASQHIYDDCIEHKLCAVIVKGGNVVSIGFNHKKTNAFVEHYADRVRGAGRDYSLSMHAEQHAISLARAVTDLRGCKIFVARTRSAKSPMNHSCALARPCNICAHVLLKYGIKKAYYTIDDNTYGVMNIVQQDIDSDKVIINSYIKEQKQ